MQHILVRAVRLLYGRLHGNVFLFAIGDHVTAPGELFAERFDSPRRENRDSRLKRFSGELNAEFYLRLVGYGALPVLGVLTSQFPAVSNFVLSWLQPTLEALH